MNVFSLQKFASIIVQAIGECNTHKVDETIVSKYRVITETKDALVFAEFCFHTLLYQAPPQGYVFLAELGKSKTVEHNLSVGHLTAIELYSSGCPAGLSVAQSERVTGKQPLKIDVLASRKVITKYVIMSVYIHILVATTCTMHLVFSWLNFLFNLFS